MKFQIFSLLDFIPEFHDETTFLEQSMDLMVHGEQLGFEGVWVGEEHFYVFGLCPSPQMFLATLAGRTSTLKLGTAVSLLSIDHPLRRAEDFAMLDVLSKGRLRYGVGRGGIPAHFPPFQIDPVDAEARMLEGLDIIRQAWSGQRFSHSGRFWHIEDCVLAPRPIQKPVPIYQASLSDAGFARAAAYGDGVFLSLVPGAEEEIAARLARYRDALRRNGKAGIAPQPSCNLHLYIDKDRAQADEMATIHMDRYSEHILSLGFPGMDLHTAKMREDMGRFLPKKSQALVGTPDDICEQIHALRKLYGLDNLGINIQAGGRDFAVARQQLDLFAREVMPEFTRSPSADPLKLQEAA